MYIKRSIESAINELLYKEFLPTCKELLPHLPFKDVDSEKVNVITKVLSRHDLWEKIEDLMLDLTELEIYGEDYSSLKPNSKVGITTVVEMYSYGRDVEKSIECATFEEQELMRDLMEVDNKACAVGGCVRDSILGLKPKDWDFVSSKSYDELRDHFEAKGYKVDETGKQFLVLIVSKDGNQFEIAMFRKDGMYEDGRRPEAVEIGTIYDDADRRDFTVNALYYRLSDMILIDPTGRGVEDIKNKILRFVGTATDRLEEDSLRAIRFYRFLQKGFEPCNKSLKAVRSHFDVCVQRTAPERIKLEIEKMVGL